MNTNSTRGFPQKSTAAHTPTHSSEAEKQISTRSTLFPMPGSGVICQQQMHRLATLLTQIQKLIEASVCQCVDMGWI